MNESNKAIINRLMKQHEKDTSEIAEKIMSLLKEKCETYGELEKDIRIVTKSIKFDNRETLADKLQQLLEKEMNDLPLTNRSSAFNSYAVNVCENEEWQDMEVEIISDKATSANILLSQNWTLLKLAESDKGLVGIFRRPR